MDRDRDKGNVRLVARVSPDLYRRIRMEAVERGMTIGDLIEEVFQSRDVIFTHTGQDKERTR